MKQTWEVPPKSDAEFFDYLARLFGYGSYDEAFSPVPYWKWRQIEIGKVGRSREKANCSLVEAVRIAQYCKVTGVLITGPQQLWRHRGEARRWWNNQEKARAEADLDIEMRDAIAAEFATPGSPFLDRLLRATGAYRREVLDEWKRSRSSPANPTHV